MPKPLWEPSEAHKESSNLSSCIPAIARITDQNISDYDALYQYSIAEPAAFWSALWDYNGVIGSKGEQPWLKQDDRLSKAQFFPTGKLNYAENALRTRGPEKAVVFWGEDKVKSSLSWDELRQTVGRFQSWLDDAELTSKDRVGAVLPNMPETIVSILGCAAQGATWSSCSPDFGPQGIHDRLGQIAPRALLICDGYYYGGKTIDISEKAASVIRELPSVEHVVVISYLGQAAELTEKLKDEFAERNLDVATWDEAIAARPACEPNYQQLPFSHPIYILFSSGTTGVPKCIVHSAGGILMKHLSEVILHSDVRPGDRLFYFATVGWMMWNWLVSGLAAGATLMLYDGNPLIRDGNILWDFAQKEKFTHFGTSAKYLSTIHKNGLEPVRTHDLSTLRMLLSTGSPLSPEDFDYIYTSIKSDLHLASISGGTDICGCFVLGNPLKPVWRGEIQGAGLGLAVDVADEEGQRMASGKGELVCRNAFPSMPIGFWQDEDGRRYEDAYFTRFPGLWHHGDFAEWSKHGGMIIHGRSDATLNPGGVRIGTAEIYRQVEKLPEIQESIVIGQPWENDVRVVLFVVLKQGERLTLELVDRVKQQIRQGASPRHVPAKVIEVSDIPRTRSGKISELGVRDVVMGREVKNKEALANPEALAEFRDLPELS